jgi:hypothetical protein
MTKMLEQVIQRMSKLPEQEQDAWAAHLLEELESEKKWDESFAKSQDILSRMAAEALAEHDRGETKPLMVDGEFVQE